MTAGDRRQMASVVDHVPPPARPPAPGRRAEPEVGEDCLFFTQQCLPYPNIQQPRQTPFFFFFFEVNGQMGELPLLPVDVATGELQLAHPPHLFCVLK